MSSEFDRFSFPQECEVSMWFLADGLVPLLTGCVFFWEMDPVFFGWERVNILCYGREKIKPVYVVPVGICWLVVL